MAEGERSSRTSFAISRVEAYTDGVFAIAATLLVLDLSTQAFGAIHSDAEMWRALEGLWENASAFVVSFLLLSLLWVIHFEQFREMDHADAALLWINNGRLLFVVLIPFTTTLVAEYSAFYAGRMLLPINFFFAVLFGWLTWAWAASKDGHLLRPESKSIAWVENRAAVSAVVCAAIAVALSPWLGSWAFLAFFLNAPIAMLLRRRRRRAAHAGAAAPAGDVQLDQQG